MKKVLLSIIALFLSCAEIKSQNTRFIDSVFASVEKTSLNYSDVFTDNYHKLDIYYPKGDVLLQRPVIFFNHGGAFYAGINPAKTVLISAPNSQKKDTLPCL
jgi:acetyl esterase/lipase